MNNSSTKVERKYHRSDKWFRRFRDASVVVLFFTLLGSMVYGYVIAQRLQDIAQRIEDSQKGTACIILILPQNRNTKNVTDCIEKNKTEHNEFRFNDEQGNPVTSEEALKPKKASITIKETPAKAPLIVVKPPDSTEEPDPPIVNIPDPVRTIERTVDALGRSVCRVQGSYLWQVGTCE